MDWEKSAHAGRLFLNPDGREAHKTGGPIINVGGAVLSHRAMYIFRKRYCISFRLSRASLPNWPSGSSLIAVSSSLRAADLRPKSRSARP